MTELSPGGDEYAKAFRAAAKRNRLKLVADILVHQTGDDLADALRHLHDEVKPDAIAYLGYGYPVAMCNPILRDLDWDPQRIMSTAFLWYISDPGCSMAWRVGTASIRSAMKRTIATRTTGRQRSVRRALRAQGAPRHGRLLL